MARNARPGRWDARISRPRLFGFLVDRAPPGDGTEQRLFARLAANTRHFKAPYAALPYLPTSWSVHRQLPRFSLQWIFGFSSVHLFSLLSRVELGQVDGVLEMAPDNQAQPCTQPIQTPI